MRNLQWEHLPDLWRKRSLTVSASQKNRRISEKEWDRQKVEWSWSPETYTVLYTGKLPQKERPYSGKRKKSHSKNILKGIIGPRGTRTSPCCRAALRVEIIMVQKLCCPVDSSTVPGRHAVLVLLRGLVLWHFSLRELFFSWGEILLKTQHREDLKEAATQCLL